MVSDLMITKESCALKYSIRQLQQQLNLEPDGELTALLIPALKPGLFFPKYLNCNFEHSIIWRCQRPAYGFVLFHDIKPESRIVVTCCEQHPISIVKFGWNFRLLTSIERSELIILQIMNS
jgi:hypothetical protein